jgi:hypothetical protein
MPVVAGLSVSRALRFASVMMLVVPAASQAATVELRPGRYSEPDNPVDIVTFTAAAGERNTVTARFITGVGSASGIWQITDASATLTAAAPCAQIDERNVSCPAVQGGRLEGAAFTLGDGDDTLDVDADTLISSGDVLSADGGPGNDRFAVANNHWVSVSGGGDDDDFSGAGRQGADLSSLLMNGGPGNDRLDGSSGSGPDFLDGGGGQDQLFGRDGNDWLSDGDRDDADAARVPGPDRLDGGAGDDGLSYEKRTAGVTVNLASDTPAGAAGENDVVVSVESARGGRGDDRLTGNRRSNQLTGGRGNDRLFGRGGWDDLDPGPGEDLTSCGRGRSDTVSEPRRGTLVTRDCESLLMLALTADPYPRQITRGQAIYAISCPDFDEDDEYRDTGCEGSARLSEASAPHRVLAQAPIPRGRRSANVERDLALPLTATGRRLATRRHGVRAVVRLHFKDGPIPIDQAVLYAWMIRLTVPR